MDSNQRTMALNGEKSGYKNALYCLLVLSLESLNLRCGHTML